MDNKVREYRLLSRLLRAKPLFTTGEIAKLLDVNINTVVLWFESDLLEGFKLPGDTARRVERDRLIELILKRELPLAVEPERFIEFVVVGAKRSLEHKFQLAVNRAFGYEFIRASCEFEAGIACAERVVDVVLVLVDNIEFSPKAFRDCQNRWKHLSYTALVALTNSTARRRSLLKRGYDAVFPVPPNGKDALDLIDKIADSA